MHEMSLIQSLLRILAEESERHGFSRVRRVQLMLGALSCAEPESLRFCFEAAKRGTMAEAALLDLVIEPGAAWCWDCEQTIALATRGAPCPGCGGYRLKVTAGDDMRVGELEVE